MRLNLPADAERVHDIRLQFEEFLASLPLARDEIEGLKVALSEACSNAICHGSPLGPANRIRVECWVEPGQLVIEVEDEGGRLPREASGRSVPDSWQTSGRGLYLMRQLTDGVLFQSRQPGLLVRMIKQLPVAYSRSLPALEAARYHARA